MEIKEIKIKIREVEKNQICICDDNGKDILYLPYRKHSLAYHYLYAKLCEGESSNEIAALHLHDVSNNEVAVCGLHEEVAYCKHRANKKCTFTGNCYFKQTDC